MNADQLKELQARLKAKYREALTAAGLTPIISISPRA
jgi:hypothetical protein